MVLDHPASIGAIYSVRIILLYLFIFHLLIAGMYKTNSPLEDSVLEIQDLKWRNMETIVLFLD